MIFKLRNIYLLACTLMCLSVSVAAQSQDTLSMTNKQYRDKVLNYSYELRQAKENVYQANKGVSAIKSGMLPTVSADVSLSYLMKNISFDIASMSLETKKLNYGATVTATQNVYAGGLVRKKAEEAAISADIAYTNQLLTIDNIIFYADQAYWTMTALASYLDVAKQYVSIVNSTQSLVRDRYDNGLISKNDLLLIEARVSDAELNYSQVEGKYKSGMIGVNIMMGAEAEASFVLSDALVVKDYALPPRANMQQVLSVRPEYLIAVAQLTKSEQTLKVTKADYLPTFAVGYTGQYETQALNFDGTAQLNGVAFAQLSIPIFTGGARKHRVSIDMSKVRNSEYALEKMRDEVVKDVSTSWSDVIESVNQLEIARKNMTAATESLDLNTYSFNEGLLSVFDLMQAQLSWLGAVNSTIEANYNYRLALSKYYKSIGEYEKE